MPSPKFQEYESALDDVLVNSITGSNELSIVKPTVGSEVSVTIMVEVAFSVHGLVTVTVYV